MNLLNQLMGGGDSNPNRATYRGKPGYERTLQLDNFTTSDVSVEPGRFNEIGRFQIGAGQFAEVGVGSVNDNAESQGRPLIDYQDSTPSGISGVHRVLHENATQTQSQKVLQRRSDDLNISNRNERVTLPRVSQKGYARVTEDSFIVLEFKPDSSNTVATAESTVSLPVTIYE